VGIREKTIAVDFDGVIHAYTKGWQGGELYDPPMEGAAKAIKGLLDEGYKVVVFTTRKDHEAIADWMVRWGLPLIPITSIKMPAIAYIDDRAVRFTNWADIRKLWA